MQLIEIKHDEIEQFLADMTRNACTAYDNGWQWVPLPRWELCEVPPDIQPGLTLWQARALVRAIKEALRFTEPRLLDIAAQLHSGTWRIDVFDAGKFEFSYFLNV